MKLELKETARTFRVGEDGSIEIKDLGDVYLAPNEQLTFVTERNARYDFVRKDWGYYATPSVNDRLANEGFKTALVCSMQDKRYVMVVERESICRFQAYCHSEKIEILCWLDDGAKADPKPLGMVKPTLQCPCKGAYLKIAFEYDMPPVGETKFDLGEINYQRRYDRCKLCGHWFSIHDMEIDQLYDGKYAKSTYGDKMGSTFDKIVALPPDNSDNAGRINRIKDFAQDYFTNNKVINLLDVGSGLGVFPYAAKQVGWQCTAIDPDPGAVKHINEYVGVSAVCGDFMQINNLGQFDIVSFNKVLEHVIDPVAMLNRASKFLKDGGFVYIELPNGEMAAKEGKGREEFFIEHHHVFSVSSMAMLISRAGFRSVIIEQLQEPSSKYTLRAFLVLNA